MKDDRLLIPIEGSYLNSLGLAAYAYARLEWNAAYCCDRMKPGYIAGLGRKTAKQIAEDLLKYAKRIADPVLREDCVALAVEFDRLTGVRNDLMHAVPGTAGDGAQRLIRYGRVWTPGDIDDAADAFTACSQGLNDLLHHRFRPSEPTSGPQQ